MPRAMYFFSTGNSDNTNVPVIQRFTITRKVLFIMSAALQLLDSFTPFNYFSLDERDGEVGSGGTLVLPDQPGTFPHLGDRGRPKTGELS